MEETVLRTFGMSDNKRTIKVIKRFLCFWLTKIIFLITL